MPLIVQKYGGSSLATPSHIRRAAKRIKIIKEEGKDLIVVVSAMGRTTDHLLKLAHKTVQVPRQRELDMLLTSGERVSMALLAMALHEEGVPAISFTGSQSGILTTNHHTEARIIDIRAHRIREELGKGRVVIIAGFQGVSPEKEITTLGRGGSDTTAVAVSVALGAEFCEILTDVDGLFSADPRIVPSAKLLTSCTYDEALELASLGAKMHSRSIELAKRYKVNVRIASSSNTECRGTQLVPTSKRNEETMEATIVRGIATKDGFHYFKVGIRLDMLVDILQEQQIAFRFFNYSAGETRFICESDKAALVRQTLQEMDEEFEEVSKVSIVSAVGDGLSSSTEILPQFMDTLRTSGAECFLLCTNSVSMTAAIPTSFKDEVTQKLHDRLVEKDNA